MQGGTRDAELLTTREVAGLLRIKERKVYDLVASGEIPHVRVTGKLLFPRALLDAWLGRHSEHIGARRASGRTSSRAATIRCSTGRCANPARASPPSSTAAWTGSSGSRRATR